ncbi:MAG TPA: ABC transporter ATP-binding protein [Candidatus Baltobacteraceae bacterium]|nr:ABC transporter ATP-binding protein [Candidatus Baltobacteraceae bacterium]
MDDRAATISIERLSIHFGGVAALSDVSFEVGQGAITGLIGPNGAGKTTLFNCITGLYRPNAGSVFFKGENLLRLTPYRIAGRRIARTFQNLELFSRMTALENVMVGGAKRAQARELLDYVGQGDTAARIVHGLPFGARKMIELARALAMGPELLLLDEPASGFGHDAIGTIGDTIQRIRRDFKTTILMVEHSMQLVMRICDRIVVLNSGQKLAEGEPAAIASNRAVIDAYLGSTEIA